MKCNRCGREIPEGESFSYQDKTLCDDCYMDVMMAQEKSCDPWATYVSTQTRKHAGQKGTEGLNESEKNIYAFVKSQGRATREEIMAKFGLSAQDLGPHFNVLMHAELVKEHSEGGTMYLIPIG